MGQSWQVLGSFSELGANDPEDLPSTIWNIGNGDIAATISGTGRVYRSSDHGASWTQMSMPDDSWWLVYHMAWNRRDGAEGVLLAEGWASGVTYGVWKSTDGGQQWRLVWAPDMLTCYETVSSLTISLDGRALMGTVGGCPDWAGVHLYWSVDAGETWVPAEPPEVSEGFPASIYGVMYLGFSPPAS